MKALVLIKPKEDVPDSPGRVVQERLMNRGFTEVKGTRVGKLIELEIEGADRDNAALRIRQMCTQLLVNQTIEDFTIQIID